MRKMRIERERDSYKSFFSLALVFVRFLSEAVHEPKEKKLS